MCQIRVNLRRWACLLAALACLLALLPLPAHAAGAASKVVRVGWYEDAYNITGKNGERSGYAYEYEQSVAAYTGWTYEYIKAGWSDLLQMMKNGEIDLMAGVSYTEDRAQDMLFSELPMGREIYYLYADLTHTDISASDLRTLNGKRIALMKTSVEAAQFYQWEEDHGLHLQYVWSNSFEQDKQQAQGREIDCVISTETPGWVEYGMSAIAQTGGSDIYFAISRTRQDLKEELDHAMRKMEFDKPFYADELYQRYLSASYTPVLSREEQDWVTQHGDIRIGFLTSDAGISTYVPESGQLVGVINDYITFASDSISNQKLDFSLVGYDSMEEEVQALKDGQIDLIFHFAQNPYVALSGGQAQRLALARTLAHPRPVLVLDDPFSALDRSTEDAIFAELQAYARDKVVFLISHRLYHFPQMQQIIFMEGGRTTVGTHEELMGAVPVYRQLYESQTGLKGGEGA